MRTRRAGLLALALWGAAQNAGADQVTQPRRTFGDGEHDVTAIAVSPDGSTVLTGSSDGIARLWDKKTGELLLSIVGHSGGIWTVAFSPDGSQVLTGGADQTARLWATTNGALIRTLVGHTNSVAAAAFAPDGRTLATGSYDRTACLWETSSGRLLFTWVHAHAVEGLALSPDGTTLLSADGDVWRWSTSTGGLLGRHTMDCDVYCVAFSHDGRQILAGGYYYRLWLLDAATGQLQGTLEGDIFHSFGWAGSVAFSPDDRLVVAASWWDGNACMWDNATARPIRSFKLSDELSWDAWDAHAVFSSDGMEILTTGPRGALLWDIRDLRPVRSLQTIGYGSLEALAVASDGTCFVTAGDAEGALYVWDTVSGQLQQEFVQSGGTILLGVSPDGQHVLMTTNGWSWITGIELWDVTTESHVRTLDPTNHVVSAVFSPDDHELLTGGDDGALLLWDLTTATVLRVFSGHTNAITCLAFSPNGQQLLTGSRDSTACLWKKATGERLRTFTHTNEITSVAFSPDGQRFVTAGQGFRVVLWDAGSGEILGTFPHTNEVTSVAFSLDGRRVLTGGSDGQARLWTTDTGELVRTFPHTNSVSCVAFSRDGELVLTGEGWNGWDNGSVRIWETATGQLLNSLEGHGEPVVAIAYDLTTQSVIQTCRSKSHRS